MEKKYVIVYTYGEKFFKEKNSNGSNVLSDSLEEAKMMTQEEAEEYLKNMKEDWDWEIWTVKTGLVLDERQTRHILKARKEALLKELESLEKEIGNT